MRKRASVDWTVGKLLNIVLLVLVLALVAYGISTQSLTPLLENVEGKFDEVLIMFNLKDDIYSKECREESIANMGGGKEFLEQIDMKDKKVILNVCKNRVCNISGEGIEPYRVSNGVFEKLGNEEWNKYEVVFEGGLSPIKFNWDLYNAILDVLDVKNVKELYDKSFTRQFILYGDGSGINKEIFAVWQNGEWRVTEGDRISDAEGWVKEGDDWVLKYYWDSSQKYWAYSIIKRVRNLYSGTDDNLAIDAFVKKVKGGNDDKVYWKETIPIKSDEKYIGSSDYGEKIGSLVGDKGFGGSFDELDSAEEIINLKFEFTKRKKIYLEDIKISKEELGELIKDKKINIRGEEILIDIEEGIFPIISFSYEKEKYGVRHSAYANINSNLIEEIKLRYFPISLVKWDGSKWGDIGNEQYYRLYEKDFKEVYRATLISEFLKSKCR